MCFLLLNKQSLNAYICKYCDFNLAVEPFTVHLVVGKSTLLIWLSITLCYGKTFNVILLVYMFVYRLIFRKIIAKLWPRGKLHTDTWNYAAVVCVCVCVWIRLLGHNMDSIERLICGCSNSLHGFCPWFQFETRVALTRTLLHVVKKQYLQQ